GAVLGALPPDPRDFSRHQLPCPMGAQRAPRRTKPCGGWVVPSAHRRPSYPFVGVRLRRARLPFTRPQHGTRSRFWRTRASAGSSRRNPDRPSEPMTPGGSLLLADVGPFSSPITMRRWPTHATVGAAAQPPLLPLFAGDFQLLATPQPPDPLAVDP